MIVGRSFDGDDWVELQWAQHDRYGEALAIIALGATNAYASALRITGKLPEPLPDFLQPGFRFDHRTLQVHHDHLAAHWRQEFGHIHPVLPPLGNVDELADDWLAWLRDQVRQWANYRPHLTRGVVRILENQKSNKIGECEDALLAELRDVYPVD